MRIPNNNSVVHLFIPRFFDMPSGSDTKLSRTRAITMTRFSFSLPTLLVSLALGAVTAQQDVALIISHARFDIERIVANNAQMGAKFLRLAFHDCVGGCDGTPTVPYLFGF
jgi:hypothetical protein